MILPNTACVISLTCIRFLAGSGTLLIMSLTILSERHSHQMLHCSVKLLLSYVVLRVDCDTVKHIIAVNQDVMVCVAVNMQSNIVETHSTRLCAVHFESAS